MKQSSPRSSVFTLIPFYLSEKGRPSRTKHVSRELVPLKQPSMRGGLLPLETCFSQLQHSRHREVFYCLREPVSVGYNTADTERWFTASGNLFQSVTTQPTPRGVLLPHGTCFSQSQHSRNLSLHQVPKCVEPHYRVPSCPSYAFPAVMTAEFVSVFKETEHSALTGPARAERQSTHMNSRMHPLWIRKNSVIWNYSSWHRHFGDT